MSNKLIHKIALFAVIIMATTMITCISPALAADTYNLTVTSNQTVYAQGATVTITGTLTDNTTGTPAANFLVGIKVTDPQADTSYQIIATTNSTGSYSTSFIDQRGTNQPAGTYIILATASDGSTQIASATTTFDVTAAPTPTPTPTPSPTPTATPTPTPSPSPTPTPTPAPTPTPTSAPTPTISPTVAPTVAPTPTTQPTPSPSPAPSPTVPEFPTAVVALIAVIATSAAVLFTRQSKSRKNNNENA